MLFISSTSNLSVSFRSPKNVYAPNGEIIDRRPRIKAQFRHGVVPPWASELAVKRLSFDFLPDGWSPEMQISAFDSDQSALENGWNDEEKHGLEQHLLARAGLNNYILAERPRPLRPWEKYDELTVHGRRTVEHVAEQIVDILRSTGIDPEVVLAYEWDNLNRPEVIAAVEAFSVPEPAEEDLIVSA